MAFTALYLQLPFSVLSKYEFLSIYTYFRQKKNLFSPLTECLKKKQNRPTLPLFVLMPFYVLCKILLAALMLKGAIKKLVLPLTKFYIESKPKKKIYA